MNEFLKDCRQAWRDARQPINRAAETAVEHSGNAVIYAARAFAGFQIAAALWIVAIVVKALS